ncbi:hypothetical protein JKP88DRAFT_312496 [Tribonema minus]|uniref:Uncharacterized protein n=1 Tax=Tribonema minus TaxID=303371 RepID=A0A835Z2N2_9STRA|nr:hypothetical protein JKP88DRAFT_312496 [Tribonema minus]
MISHGDKYLSWVYDPRVGSYVEASPAAHQLHAVKNGALWVYDTEAGNFVEASPAHSMPIATTVLSARRLPHGPAAAHLKSLSVKSSTEAAAAATPPRQQRTPRSVCCPFRRDRYGPRDDRCRDGGSLVWQQQQQQQQQQQAPPQARAAGGGRCLARVLAALACHACVCGGADAVAARAGESLK